MLGIVSQCSYADEERDVHLADVNRASILEKLRPRHLQHTAPLLYPKISRQVHKK
jgi:hypothetical protein